MSADQTVAGLIRDGARDHPDRLFCSFENDHVSWGEYERRCQRVANMLRARLPEGAPPHVGVLAENTPVFLELLGGAALAGVVAVGVNATRRGTELERDIRHADCALVVADKAHRTLLRGLDLPPVLECGSTYEEALEEAGDETLFWPVAAQDLFALVFTSATTGAPKAVRCSHRRMIGTGSFVADLVELTADDCAYVAMPLFHANAQQCGWMPALLRGARVALARRFGVRRFLPDVRLHGATYFPYSGKPLSLILSEPERPADGDNPLRVCFGNEGSWKVVERFERRFRCRVIDGFGAAEAGFGFPRRPDDPPGSVGMPPSEVKVFRNDGTACPPARFDASGRLLNAGECVGEIVNTTGIGRFEGYWNTPRPRRAACATGCTGRGTSATSTSAATSTSPVAPRTGSASTARTSHPARSRS